MQNGFHCVSYMFIDVEIKYLLYFFVNGNDFNLLERYRFLRQKVIRIHRFEGRDTYCFLVFSVLIVHEEMIIDIIIVLCLLFVNEKTVTLCLTPLSTHHAMRREVYRHL